MAANPEVITKTPELSWKVDEILLSKVPTDLPPYYGDKSEPNPFLTAETVEESVPLVEALMAEQAIPGATKRYSRSVLRQQHIIAFMLVNPFATCTEVCAFFSISPSTFYNITKSDTFKALINKHKVTLENTVGQDLQDQLRATLSAAIEVTQRAVVEKQDPDFALAVLDKTANRLGLGAKHNTNVNINNNIVTPDMIALARARRSVTTVENAALEVARSLPAPSPDKA